MREGQTIADVIEGRADWCVATGDCLAMLPSIPSGSVGAVVTDPPYFQPAAHYCPTRTGSHKKSIGDMSILESFFRLFIAGAAEATAANGTLYVFCDGQSYPIAFTGLYPIAKHVRPLVWDKVVSFNGYTWRHQHELIAWAEREGTPRVPTGDGDVLRCRAVPVEDRTHPAEKPVELITTLLAKVPEGIVVLDPFCGSGTTGVAAIKTGRKFIGIEIDPTYADIARRRIREAVPTLFQPPSPRETQTEIFA